jgi:hypothetical protein
VLCENVFGIGLGTLEEFVVYFYEILSRLLDIGVTRRRLELVARSGFWGRGFSSHCSEDIGRVAAKMKSRCVDVCSGECIQIED